MIENYSICSFAGWLQQLLPTAVEFAVSQAMGLLAGSFVIDDDSLGTIQQNHQLELAMLPPSRSYSCCRQYEWQSQATNSKCLWVWNVCVSP